MVVWLLLGILACTLLVLYFVVAHQWSIEALTARLDKVPVAQEQHLKAVVQHENAATRNHLSIAVDSIRSDTEMSKRAIYDFVEGQKKTNSEFRAHLTIQKSRIQWLIGTVDKLSEELKTFGTYISVWLGLKKP